VQTQVSQVGLPSIGRCESIELATDTGRPSPKLLRERRRSLRQGGKPQEGRQSRKRQANLGAADTLRGSGCHGLRVRIVAKPVRGGVVNASPRLRGRTPWRGRKPKRASASEPPKQRSGGTDPRGEQSPEVGLPQFGPRNSATSASVRSPSGGRAHLGRAPSGVVP
jgi:hypothetical protein